MTERASYKTGWDIASEECFVMGDLDLPKIKLISLSLIIFFLVIAISSLFYIQYDFLNNDVKGVTAFYGWVQLVLVFSSIFVGLLTVKLKKRFLLLAFISSFVLLLFIQIAPAILWFWFNGQIVNDKPYGGVVGNWIFGAYHLFIIIWGFFNIIKIHLCFRSGLFLKYVANNT